MVQTFDVVSIFLLTAIIKIPYGNLVFLNKHASLEDRGAWTFKNAKFSVFLGCDFSYNPLLNQVRN